MPRNPKAPQDRVRRNKPEQWTVLPAEGCDKSAPEWPFPRKPTKAEAAYWEHVWKQPIAWWWHEQQVSPYVIARYVKTFCKDASDVTLKLGPAVSRMERDLGLHLEGLAKLRLIVAEEGEEVRDQAGKGRFKHLRVVGEE